MTVRLMGLSNAPFPLTAIFKRVFKQVRETYDGVCTAIQKSHPLEQRRGASFSGNHRISVYIFLELKKNPNQAHKYDIWCIKATPPGGVPFSGMKAGLWKCNTQRAELCGAVPGWPNQASGKGA
ncbi:hypothetical protein XENOCAPTIV_014533 [Xenoophorus captivus]|uniref:Uncharacterized protein n=1 Tax=Xenoophorus captivus TaxID=1517983 RepID=A0ABV0RT41_9TELE